MDVQDTRWTFWSCFIVVVIKSKVCSRRCRLPSDVALLSIYVSRGFFCRSGEKVDARKVITIRDKENSFRPNPATSRE